MAATNYFQRHMTGEGLVPASKLRLQAHRLYIAASDEEVFVEPELMSLVEFLSGRQDLWEIAQLKVFSHDVSQKRAPVFGVPFDVALQKLNEPRSKGFIPSIFKRQDEDRIRDEHLGVTGRLVAHVGREVRKDPDVVTLEAWELMDHNAETFYIHGRFSRRRDCFVHFDGATMSHDEAGKCRLFWDGRKVKGIGYEKRFRLDGTIATESACEIAKRFLPLEDLTTEYLRAKNWTGPTKRST